MAKSRWVSAAWWIAALMSLHGCGATSHSAADVTDVANNNDLGDEVSADPEDESDALPTDVHVTAAPTGAGLLAEAQRELAAAMSSQYVHRTHVDELNGTFDYDCSGFIGYALSRIAPDALAAVQAQTRRRPLAKHFEAFFASLAPMGHPWARVEHVAELMPGDLIAWLEPADKRSHNTGHIMVVAARPYQGVRVGELEITVIDSSHSGHGVHDARIQQHRNGIGVGKIILMMDSSGRAIGYRWSTAKRSRPYETQVAMARLVG